MAADHQARPTRPISSLYWTPCDALCASLHICSCRSCQAPFASIPSPHAARPGPLAPRLCWPQARSDPPISLFFFDSKAVDDRHCSSSLMATSAALSPWPGHKNDVRHHLLAREQHLIPEHPPCCHNFDFSPSAMKHAASLHCRRSIAADECFVLISLHRGTPWSGRPS
jgi:hypothetical protein